MSLERGAENRRLLQHNCFQHRPPIGPSFALSRGAAPAPDAAGLRPNRCGPMVASPPFGFPKEKCSVPFIVYDQRLYLLNAGQNRLGSGADVDVQLPELTNGCHVGIHVERCGSYAWVSGDEGDVTINGHPINEDPVPLFDGDQMTVQGRGASSILYFIDDSSRYIVRSELPPPVRAVARASSADTTAAKGESQPRHSGPLITWILLLALAELLAVLVLS